MKYLRKKSLLFVLLLTFGNPFAFAAEHGIHGAEINAYSSHGDTALIRAIYGKNRHEVRQLLQAGADLYQAKRDGHTSFEFAYWSQDERLVDLVLNWQDKDGTTPFIRALYKHQYSLAEQLLSFGANPCLSKYDRSSPMQFVDWALGSESDLKAREKLIDIKHKLQQAIDLRAHEGCKIFPVYHFTSVDSDHFFRRRPIVFTGDSLTAGFGSEKRTYPQMLAQEVGLPIINTGIGGNTSKDLLQRLSSDVLIYQPAIVAMTIGGNDIMQALWQAPLNKAGFVSYLLHPHATMENLRTIFHNIRNQSPNTQIILGLITPGGPLLEKVFRSIPYLSKVVKFAAKLASKKWSRAIKDMALQEQVIVVEGLLDDHWTNGSLLFDDIHPNEQGYEIVKDKFLPALRQAIELVQEP